MRICSVEGCLASHWALGYCRLHYERVKKRGTPDELPPFHPANPWAGHIACPSCDSDEWTLPWTPNEPRWRCVSCHSDFMVGVGR